MISVEFSDRVGETEEIPVMLKKEHVYIDAEKLAKRLGYQVRDTNDTCVSIYNNKNKDLPYGITQFFYDDTKVYHTIFSRVVKNYEAPFPTIKNEEGIWIPMEYALLILNSSMMLLENTVLIDIPQKSITDIYKDIMENNSRYLFDWDKDIGYSDSEWGLQVWTNQLVNNGNELINLLELESDSWLLLIQSIVLKTAAYDYKYGEDIAILICTESNEQLDKSVKDMKKCQKLFDEKGTLGKLLATYGKSLDENVGNQYAICEKILKKVKKSSSYAAEYNKSYQMLEKAMNKQAWLSLVGEPIRKIQGNVSKEIPFMGIAVKVGEVVNYGMEFARQDEFSKNALVYFLEKSSDTMGITEDMRKSMKKYTDRLDKGALENTVVEYVKKNALEIVAKNAPMEKLLGEGYNTAFMVWDLASTFVPFISEGLTAADKFELAVYASFLQTDSFVNYQNCRNSIFNDEEKITAEELYHLSEYAYVYLKTCYIVRNAAVASLKGKSSDIQKEIQPLIEYQNGINKEIAAILVRLKDANKMNEGMVYGFLPTDNDAYLKKYSDEKLKNLCEETGIEILKQDEPVIEIPNLDVGTGYHVFIHQKDFTWEEAKEFCERYGGHLAVVRSQQENDAIVKLINEESYRGFKNAYWLGAEAASKGEWKWITGGDLEEYSNWSENNPDAYDWGAEGIENYLAMYTGMDALGNETENICGEWNDYTNVASNIGFVGEWEIPQKFTSEQLKLIQAMISFSYDYIFYEKRDEGEDMPKEYRIDYQRESAEAFYQCIANGVFTQQFLKETEIKEQCAVVDIKKLNEIMENMFGVSDGMLKICDKYYEKSDIQDGKIEVFLGDRGVVWEDIFFDDIRQDGEYITLTGWWLSYDSDSESGVIKDTYNFRMRVRLNSSGVMKNLTFVDLEVKNIAF